MWPVGAIALVSYLPMLFSSPGQISADTKSYLYLDPGSLLRSATSMWDPGLALGYVPHQNTGYLWPMGPWYWVWDAVGMPDWLAQRLWWGSLLFAAGAGVVAFGRRLGWSDHAAVAAGLVYACSPYSLVFLARISGILMPWAALPWLILLSDRAVRSGGWRYPAVFALVAATAGSTNLTALLLAGFGPLLWVGHLAVAGGRARLPRVVRACGRIIVLTAGASAWWLVGLAVQAANGTDVLRYSETAEVVTSESNGSEILRGLGNWFFYGRDRLGPWIEPSVSYTQRIPLLIVTLGLPVAALAVGALMRWRHRLPSLMFVAVGLVLSVGAYPWEDPPPLGRVIRSVLLDERGFALRALNRATPLVILGLSLLVGGGLTALAARRPRRSSAVALAVIVLAVAGLPPLWQGQLVPRNLRRDESIPTYWRQAADRLEASTDGTRVLELPGSDFASYRWGNTVDPITPGLMDRPVAYRELIPFGPPESAALLGAVDLGLQERTLPSTALAPLARLLRAGDVLVRSDLEFERFNTPRPKDLADLVARATGFGPLEGFGPGAPNRPDPDASLDDEIWLLGDHLLDDPPEVGILPVTDPIPIVAAQSTRDPVIVAGDAFGLVALASAELIDGRELLRYSAGLSDEALVASLDAGGTVVITDTNRKRAQRWQSIRFTQGFTEPADGGLLTVDRTDNRLPFFDDLGTDPRTVSVQDGDVSATASSAGNGYVLEPQDRPAGAVDGDVRTAWRTGGLNDPTGEYLRLRLGAATTMDRVRLLQPTTRNPDRWITRVRIRFDDGTSTEVTLDESSRSEPGQLVTLDPRRVRAVDLEILETEPARGTVGGGAGSVGFAEVGLGIEEPKVVEWVRTPVDLPADRTAALAAAPTAVVLTRLRADPADFLRDDEERQIARIVGLPRAGQFVVSGSVRLSARATDAAIEGWLQRGGPVVAGAEHRLLGSRWTGASALDGDPSTWWISPRGGPIGSALRLSAAGPTSVEHLDLQVVADGRFSVPTQLDVSVDGGPPVVVTVPAVHPGPTAGTVVAVRATLPRPVVGRHFVVRVTGADVATVTDWNSSQPIDQPVAIAELGVTDVRVPALPTSIDTGCRTDLVEIDGLRLPVRVTGSTADALAGRPLRLRGCGTIPELAAGDHRIRTALGIDHGLDVDQLILHTPDALQAGSPLLRAERTSDVDVTVRKDTATHIEADLRGPPGAATWVVLGQSYQAGWSADGQAGAGSSLGSPALVDGFANGWRVQLDDAGRARLLLRFRPQGPVRTGQMISLLTALGCLVLAAVGRRGSPTPDPAPVRWTGPHRPASTPQPTRTLVASGLAAGAAGLLVLPPPLALLLAAAVVAGVRWRPAATLVRFAPIGLTGLAGVLVIAEQVAEQTKGSAGWASAHGASHLLVILAVLLVVVDELLDRRWARLDGRGGPPRALRADPARLRRRTPRGTPPRR